MREALHRALAPLLIAVAFAAHSAAPVFAEVAEPGELEKLQKEIDTSLERQKELKAQADAARASRDRYQAELDRSGLGAITTIIEPAGEFFYAEDYHQQYLAKNPDGYCGIGGTGVVCPIGTGVSA